MSESGCIMSIKWLYVLYAVLVIMAAFLWSYYAEANADDLQSIAVKESVMTDSSRRVPDYVYRAIVTEVYDGDTITVDIDLGFGVWMRDQTLRLYGIDTPELRKEEKEHGLKVRDYVRDLILGKEVTIESFKGKKGKYGRWLATVFYDSSHSGQINLNEELLIQGLAKPYDK